MAKVFKHFGIEFRFPDAVTSFTELDAKKLCFLYPIWASKHGGPTHYRKEDWFWEIVYTLWGKGAKKQFVCHPWAETMAEAASHYRYVGLSGCASSGKSDFSAVWGIVNWLAAPMETKVFASSTTKEEAKGRIWGKIRDYWDGAAFKLPGTFLNSVSKIITSDGVIKGSDTSGIQLVAGARSKEREAVGSLIGFKAPRVVFLADELAELAPGILEACWGNLGPGNPDTEGQDKSDTVFGFQMLASSNFRGYMDPFGVFTEPKDGWRSVNIDTERWETKRGICIRFDGLKSPNLSLAEDKWPIYGHKNLKEHEAIGRNTVQFWRMCRSFPAPEGVSDVIYSEQELLQGGAFENPRWSERPIIKLAALDPAFTSGGDRSVLIFGSLGYDTLGKRILRRDETLFLKEDVTDKAPYDKQVALQFKNECQRRGIPTDHAAHDATGSGISFGTLLAELWPGDVLPIKFGGSASEMPVQSGDKIIPAHEAYVNRVSEIWYQGKEYVRSGQIMGIDRDLAEEMTARHYEVQKGKETRVLVESKKDMKLRLSRSPDIADAFMILINLAIVRFGFSVAGSSMQDVNVSESSPSKLAEKNDAVYDEGAVTVGAEADYYEFS